MPTICIFLGITIMMYLRDKEHNPPHVHAFYGGEAASVLISNGELLDGSLPNKIAHLVKEFVIKNKDTLQTMWDTGVYKKLGGLN